MYFLLTLRYSSDFKTLLLLAIGLIFVMSSGEKMTMCLLTFM